MPTLLRLPYWALLFWAALHAVASAAPGQPLQPGTYIRAGDTGTLTLRRSVEGGLVFELDTLGANAHECSASGRVICRVATAHALNDDRPEEVCRLEFQTQGQRIRVSALTWDICASHCGALAVLGGDCGRPPASCTSKAISQRRALFLKQYRAKQHAQAVQSAEALLKDCSDFLFWITQDGIRSDLALAQLRAGQPQACLATLEQTAAGKVADEDGLRAALPPVEYDSYEWANAIWHNRRLCQQALHGDAGWLDPIKGRLELGAARQWAERSLTALRASRADAEVLGPILQTDWSPLLMFKADGRSHAALLRLQTAQAAWGADSAVGDPPAGPLVQLGIQLFREEASGWIGLQSEVFLSPVLRGDSEVLEVLRWGAGRWGLRWKLRGGGTQYFTQLWPGAAAGGILWQKFEAWGARCPPGLSVQDMQMAIEQAMSRQGAGPADWQEPSQFCGLQFEHEYLRLLGSLAPVLKLRWYGIEVDAKGLRRSAVQDRFLMLGDGRSVHPGVSPQHDVEPAFEALHPVLSWDPRGEGAVPAVIRLDP